MGPGVRLSRHRYVPAAIPRDAGPRLPELPGADPAVGEDEVSARDGAPAHRDASAPATLPPVSEKLGYLAAQASMVEAMLSGMEASGSKCGEYWVPNKHFMYAAQVLTQDLYPQFINAIRELSGGALIMLPSSIEDFKDPMLSKIIHTTQRAASIGAGGQGQIPQSLLGRDRFGVRLAPPAIRDVLCRRALRHRRPQLPDLRLERRDRHGGEPVGVVLPRRRAEPR